MLNYFSIFKNLKKFSNRKETDKQIFKQEVPLQKPDQSAHIRSGYQGSGYLLWREYLRLAASLISDSLLSPIRPGGGGGGGVRSLHLKKMFRPDMSAKKEYTFRSDRTKLKRKR